MPDEDGIMRGFSGMAMPDRTVQERIDDLQRRARDPELSGQSIQLSDREPPRSSLTFTMPDGSTMMVSSISFSQSIQPIDAGLLSVPEPKRKRTKKQAAPKPPKPAEPLPDVWDQI